MNHYYQNIQGWFNQTGLYNHVVKKYNNAHFVEIGSWKGRSASYMGVEIINSGKNIRFDVVDTFKGSKEHSGLDRSGLYNEFIKNTEPIKSIIGDVNVMSSVEAAKLYKDESLDFVFIDAAHDETNVLADCSAWWPKIKIGGTMGGDDYDPHWGGVISGVNKFFNKIKPIDLSFKQHWHVVKTE